MDNSGNIQLNYCYNCMTKLESGQTVCPVCGHDNSCHENPESTLPAGTILAEKYLVGKVLDRGEAEITYLGCDTSLDDKVVIKEYFPVRDAIRSLDSVHVIMKSDMKTVKSFREGCDKFLKEAGWLASIESPNIVRIRDYFREYGTAHFVMDYPDGNILTKEVAACGGKMPWQRAMELFKPLIMEMEKLHEKNMIHRDIRPDNIKAVKDEDGTERLVLLDFGWTRRFPGSRVSYKVTPGYSPFEQYFCCSWMEQGQPCMDIYALCGAMYLVITGNPPNGAIHRLFGGADLKTFRELGIGVPDHIEKAILHGLELRGTDRPQSMREFYNELEGKVSEATAAVPTQKPLRVGDVMIFGQYKQDRNLNSGAEAIEWLVLEVEKDRALVISLYCLERKKYNEKRSPLVTWETCTLRSWLNGEFYNTVFSTAEKRRILNVTIKNPDNPQYRTKGGNDTKDRIFLLSIDEAKQYFANDAARRCSHPLFLKKNRTYARGWWLRSPGRDHITGSAVESCGNIYIGWDWPNFMPFFAVRPAFWLKL